MKHALRITIILLVMFLVTQFIGLFVVNHYINNENPLPYGFEPSREDTSICSDSSGILACFGVLIFQTIFFALAITLFLFLIRIKAKWFLKTWFFLVVVISLAVSLAAFANIINIKNATLIALILAIIIGYIKVFRRNMLVHNFTELFIYPGVAAVITSLLFFLFGKLTLFFTILILIAISIYDIWAVWHSGIMQKMAKFQMNELGVLGGFLIPYADKKVKDKIRLLKLKFKNKDIPQSIIKKNKIKVNIAILGGGDIVFPIIAAGVFFKTFHSFAGALCVILLATLALLYLFAFAKKKKFYPAMPYISTGIFIGMIVGYLISLI